MVPLATSLLRPAQRWPDWAVRLTDDPASSSHDKFLPAALIALLLPHSGTPLNQVTAMVSGQLRRHITGYHMSKLTGSALRILTELALAIDDRGIPIDYRRRRDLAASATLIDDAAWARMTREAGMRLAPAASARRYLYELRTGCALSTAPPPYRLSPGSLGSYNDFALGIPASLATALAGHARRLLDGWGIGGEPLHWQPPDDWVTVTTWPGADPAPIHHALLNDETPPAQIAADLGISLGHLRQVLRRHPLPRPRRPVRYTLIPAPEPAARPPGQQPGVTYLDPAWLRWEYLTWHQSPGRHRRPDRLPAADPEQVRPGPRHPRPEPRHQHLHPGGLGPRHPPARPARTAPQRPGRAARATATTCSSPPGTRPQSAGHAWLSLTPASRADNCPSACAMATASWYSRHPVTCPSRTRSTPMNGAAARRPVVVLP